MMSPLQCFQKRAFDLIVSTFGLLLIGPVVLLLALLAWIDTRAGGFFIQQRVGRYGHLFGVVKLRTMIPNDGSTVTMPNDPRITRFGAWLRRWKLDELPQLWNVFIGDMSFVGPRPDVPGFLDQLEGKERAIQVLRPGITGPASIKYRNEAEILGTVADPEAYNRSVIWPDKVEINLEYMQNWKLSRDLYYIVKTIFG